MKKRIKGFTLLELLAVIVVLAIILLIVVPIVLNVIGDARKGAFESSAMGLIKTAENECLAERLTRRPTLREISFENWEMVSEEKLVFSGQGPMGGDIHINSRCRVEIAIHNGDWCITKTYDENEITTTPYDGDCSLGGQIITGLTNDCSSTDYYVPSYSIEEINCLITGNCEDVILSEHYLGAEGTFIPIANATELNQIRDSAINTFGLGTVWEDYYEGGLDDKNYIQVSDIDLIDYISWVPFSWAENIIYDGGGYSITNLEITEALSSYLGLFAGVDEGIFRNIIFESPYFENMVKGGGTLLGFGTGIIMENVIAKNVVIINSVGAIGSTGGLIGDLDGWVGKNIVYNSHVIDLQMQFENCGTGFWSCYRSGGLIGFADYIEISNSTARNIFISDDGEGYSFGGLIGNIYDWDGPTLIENCCATGEIVSNSNIGGLVGEIFFTNYGLNIFNSYSQVDITARNFYAGSFIGVIWGYEPNFEISNAYATGQLNADFDPEEELDYWHEYHNGFIGLLDYWPNQPFDYNVNRVILSYYDKDTTQKDGVITNHINYSTRFDRVNEPANDQLDFFWDPITMVVESDRALPNWNQLSDLRRIEFDTGTHCYWGEVLGTFNSTNVWQDFTVSYPSIHFPSRINLYRNGTQTTTTNYSIQNQADGIIRARGTAGHEVTVDYCTMNIPIYFTFELDSNWHGKPKSTNEMKQQNTYENWDFDNIWGIDPNINKGYPYFSY